MTTLRIGSIEMAVVSDGQLRMDPTLMFGPDQPEAFRHQVQLEAGRVPFSVNCALLRVGERKILLDTGAGRDEPALIERYGHGCGCLVDNLNALGVAPAEIDTVVLSHAHADHVGGACAGGVPAFPNARYWISKAEWDFWTTPERLAERPFLARKLVPLTHRLQLADGEAEVASGVRLLPSPGHTPGHVCVVLTSGQETAVYCGDLLHHLSQVEHTDWSPAFDLLPQQSAESRRRVLERAVRDRAILLTAHLPTPGLLEPTPSGWRTA
jgi:glyoxylase-like metal-dependent hydrolase (beta-lactamase superfamily II)